jgi:DNA-binding CsgD family transcriptional regulator
MYSMGFGLHDDRDMCKCSIMFDRTSHFGFSEEEIDILQVIQPHLDNLHKNLYASSDQEAIFQVRIEPDLPLTGRESEIAALLRDGVAPVSISRRLSLSLATVYKHIANIHLKLHVTNRQELILKLLKTNAKT